MSVSNINSGIHAGGYASPRKVCNEIKEKNDGRIKNFLMTGRTLYGYCRS